MKWIELIRVCSAETTLRSAMPMLEEQLEGIAASTPDAETFFLQHALYDGDLAIAVVWQTEAHPTKSREGLMVADSLQGLGTVDHSVWLPINQGSL